jgi:hypothetical protein
MGAQALAQMRGVSSGGVLQRRLGAANTQQPTERKKRERSLCGALLVIAAQQSTRCVLFPPGCGHARS